MAEKTYLLILRLEGCLQSWGENAKWDFRDSARMPSKSAVIGLIGCAMGLERGNPGLKALFDAVKMAVRADRPGTVLTDYHTVSSDRLLAASGAVRGSTIITPRQYLQDACFTVVLETDAVNHARIAAALKAPRWCLYLGRKSCVPSRPVLECEQPEYSSLLEALRKYPKADRAAANMTFETEIPGDDLTQITRPDGMEAGIHSFAMRPVWRGVVKEDEYVPDSG